MIKRLLTIVLTTYNRPNYLEKSIKSIINQDFKDFNLIILDNGSTGSQTTKVINSFNDQRIQIRRFDLNNLENINASFSYAKFGEYFMITHDDDIMGKGMLKELIKILNGNKKINIAGCSINLIDEKGNDLNKIRPRIIDDTKWKKNEFIKAYLFKGNIIPCPTCIYRSRLIIENDLKYKWKVGPANDLFLFFEANLLEGIIFLSKKVLFNYRVHLSQGIELNRIKLEYKVRPFIIKLLEKNKEFKILRRYKKASLGIILNIILNELITSKIPIMEFKNHFIKLKSLGLNINFYSLYWGFIGVLRGLKNLIIL